MSYGSPEWADWVLGEEASLPLFKAAYDAGITTWDTANMYSNGESEKLVRKAIEKYNIPRERLVIMSKCHQIVDEDDIGHRVMPGTEESKSARWVNQWGLSRKHIMDAVDKSVERLGTYIDVLQIHRLDKETEAEEIMEALHDCVKSGKVRYVGASSMCAHEFATLQYTAIMNKWTPFISMQNFYNLLYREEEREMIPFCNKMGVGLVPWSPLARGTLARPWQSSKSARTTSDPLYKMLVEREAASDQEIVGRVEKVAKDRDVSMAIVGLAWVLSKGVAPIVGMSKTERIDEAVAALKFKLSEDDIKFLEEAYVDKKVFGHS